MSSERFWSLYERYRDAGVAEVIAWAAVDRFSRCRVHECDNHLWLLEQLGRMVAGYLIAFPDGPHAEEVRDVAERWLGTAASMGCGPFGPVPGALLGRVRTQVASLAPEDRELFAALLDRLEACGGRR